MSTVALPAITPAQRSAARIAGAWYLFAMAAGMFAELFTRSGPKTAASIAANIGLYRLGTVTHLVVFAGDVILAVSLYLILRPVNRNVARLAIAWRLIACAVLAANMLFDFAILQVVSGAYLKAFDPKQLESLVRLFYNIEGAGFQIGFVFLGLGSAIYSVVWWQSRYVPRGLAGLGIFASSVMVLVTLAILLVPALGVIGLSYMAPMFFYEVGLGLWLLIKGLREPQWTA
jgi:Domain of unknown function (DUF4386)